LWLLAGSFQLIISDGLLETVPRLEKAGRGGFMRRFLTLVSLLCLALPAGITFSGCTRNPGANYCNGLGYGLKVDDISSITLQPQTSGISLAFGQTQQISAPSANTCKGAGASASKYTYGTTNSSLVDISPSGLICAGTWNRNSGGGIADYTTCNKPNPLPTTNGQPYAIAYITASADSVTSNPVEVYVHAQVTSISLVGSQQCYSQTATAQLDSQACYSNNGTQALFCAPAGLSSSQYACPLPAGVTSVPTCSASLGAFTYSVGNSTVGSIDSNTNKITALLPGTTAINASVAGSGSSAGYFSVCPPKSITLQTASGTTSATITQGVSQTLTSTVTDTNGNSITGLSLDYQSTNPIDISVSAGTVSALHPGVATIYATCQPSTCNPSPLNELGLYATGLSTSSNPVTVTTPGTTSDYVWFGAPGKSQTFVSINLLTGTTGSTVKLPYVPNSMLMDRTGNSIYFGSSHELMIYSTTNNSLSKQDPNVPGVVVAISPDNSQALINDPARQIIYLYNTSSGTSSTFNGLVAAAAWTADAKTMYAVDSATLNTGGVTGHTNTLYVYSINTGWSTYDLTATGGAWGVAPTIPGIGAYLAGPYTQARAWCPAGSVGSSANLVLYPQADLQTVQTDAITATTDGNHILGATQTGGGITLTDIGLTIPSQTVGSIKNVPAACPYTSTGSGSSQVQTLSGLTFSSSLVQSALTGINPTSVNQIVAAPVNDLAFITYSASSSNTGAKLPYYIPGAKGTLGSIGYVTLAGNSAISAPLAGAFSPDNSLFFVSTAGDNLIHFISIPATVSASNPPTDSQQLAPGLPACSAATDSGCTYTGTGTVVPATVITVIPRATT
jgi:hypothetical protein